MTDIPYVTWEIESQEKTRLVHGRLERLDLRRDGFNEGLVGTTIWLLQPETVEALPDGTRVISINGEEKIKGKDHLDDDTRGGYTAWGLLPEEWRARFGSAVDQLADKAP
jgi:hypothetical protein